MLQAAVIQLNSSDNVQANLDVAGALLERAARSGASLAVLPENFAFMGADETAKFDIAEELDEQLQSGPIQRWLSHTCRRLKLWVVAGTIPTKTSFAQKVGPTCLVVNGLGEYVAHYNKMHLFDVDAKANNASTTQETYRESATVQAGERVVVVDTPIGKVGLSICYDVRFPELFRSMQALGAQVFCVPAAFTVPTGEAHWQVLLRARAIENLCYLLAPAQVGVHASGRQTYGHSLIVNPWGEVLSEVTSQHADVACAPIDLQNQQILRERFPALQHRREGLL
jgi:deaminated glutathione amidase